MMTFVNDTPVSFKKSPADLCAALQRWYDGAYIIPYWARVALDLILSQSFTSATCNVGEQIVDDSQKSQNKCY